MASILNSSWEILNTCAYNSKSYYYEHDSNYLGIELNDLKLNSAFKLLKRDINKY